MTRADVAVVLRGFARELRIDPADAADILGEVGADGVDVETLGDYLDGWGYPELAREMYARAEVAARNAEVSA